MNYSLSDEVNSFGDEISGRSTLKSSLLYILGHELEMVKF